MGSVLVEDGGGERAWACPVLGSCFFTRCVGGTKKMRLLGL